MNDRLADLHYRIPWIHAMCGPEAIRAELDAQNRAYYASHGVLDLGEPADYVVITGTRALLLRGLRPEPLPAGLCDPGQTQTSQRGLVLDSAITEDTRENVIEGRIRATNIGPAARRPMPGLDLNAIESSRMQEGEITRARGAQGSEHSQTAREQISRGPQFAQGADSASVQPHNRVGVERSVLRARVRPRAGIRAVDSAVSTCHGLPTSWRPTNLHQRIIGLFRGRDKGLSAPGQRRPGLSAEAWEKVNSHPAALRPSWPPGAPADAEDEGLLPAVLGWLAVVAVCGLMACLMYGVMGGWHWGPQ